MCRPSACARSTSFGPADVGGGLPGSHRLYHNTGRGSFVEVAAAAGVNFASPTMAEGFGSVFGDYDLDGDLDLCVTTHTTGTGNPPPSDGNRLYRNNGDGTFTDVTASALGASIDGVRGFQPVFVDMNADLYPELLISADFGTSRYYVNNADSGVSGFTEFTTDSGTGLDANGMGNTVADFNNDGVLDWYVTSIHLEGPWNPLVPGTGNMLYFGQGNHLHVELAIPTGTSDGGWGWGTLGLDLDQDGWLDIVEVNGWPADKAWIGERGKLFRNNGNAIFSEIAFAAGFDTTGQGRGVAHLDADGDGDLDIAVCNYDGPLQLFVNDTVRAGNWLRISFNTSTNGLIAPDGIGTLKHIF